MRVSITRAGIAGLLLTWALPRRGVEVVLFDAGPVPNPGSSSFDERRILVTATAICPDRPLDA